MGKQLLFCILAILAQSFCKSQLIAESYYPKNYFGNPLNIELKLAGSFCELRSNHFHAGIDIQTDSKIGLPVMASADGYISRIKISATGYGKALYVTHPNGFTTVYGHLDHFPEPLNTYIRNEQYKYKSFEIEILPNFGQLSVKKGEIIAYSGNSGSSGGPHLHFEIRDTKSEHTLNPLLFRLTIKDNIAPLLSSIKFYNLDNGYYQSKYAPISIKKNNGIYSVKSAIVLPQGNVGIAINGYDNMEGSSGKLGFYQVQMFVNKLPIYNWKADEMSFDETRYINSFMDFNEKEANNKNYYHCFRLPGNLLNYKDIILNNGYIAIKNQDTLSLKIVVKDFNGNSSICEIPVLGKENEKSNTIFQYNPFVSTRLKRQGLEILFEKGNFYDKLNLNYSILMPKVNEGIYSAIHILDNTNVPCHLSSNISISPLSIPDNLKEKALIVVKDKKGNEMPIISSWLDGKLNGRIKTIGTYYIRIDTTCPIIRFTNFNIHNLVFKNNIIQAHIKDNLSNIASINGFIDGKWILFEYDMKNNMIKAIIDKSFSIGKHRLELIIIDNSKNENRTSQFFLVS